MKGKYARNGLYDLRDMTDTEAAWLGAMIDAEGTVRQRRATGQRENRVNVVNTELEIISACLRLTQVGSVSLRTPREHCQNVWVWQITHRPVIEELFQRIAPWSLKAQKWVAQQDISI